MPYGRQFDTSGESIVIGRNATTSNRDGNDAINASNVGTVSGDTKVINGSTYYRRYAVFNISVSGNYSINLWGDPIRADVAYPKIEKGTKPTAFFIQSGSMIKQSANEIELGITNKLGQTGIRIDGNNRKVNLQADKVTFSDAQGGNTDKIWIDPTTGTLHAVDGVFEGSLLFHKVRRVLASWNYENFFAEVYEEGVVTSFRLTHDILAITDHPSTTQTFFNVVLPSAKFMPGASIRIINATYDSSSGFQPEPTTIRLNVVHAPIENHESHEDSQNPGVYMDDLGTLILFKNKNNFYSYGFFSEIEFNAYQSIELVSMPNVFQRPDLYVWMIIDAKERPGMTINNLDVSRYKKLTFDGGILKDYNI